MSQQKKSLQRSQNPSKGSSRRTKSVISANSRTFPTFYPTRGQRTNREFRNRTVAVVEATIVADLTGSKVSDYQTGKKVIPAQLFQVELKVMPLLDYLWTHQLTDPQKKEILAALANEPTSSAFVPELVTGKLHTINYLTDTPIQMEASAGKYLVLDLSTQQAQLEPTMITYDQFNALPLVRGAQAPIQCTRLEAKRTLEEDPDSLANDIITRILNSNVFLPEPRIYQVPADKPTLAQLRALPQRPDVSRNFGIITECRWTSNQPDFHLKMSNTVPTIHQTVDALTLTYWIHWNMTNNMHCPLFKIQGTKQMTDLIKNYIRQGATHILYEYSFGHQTNIKITAPSLLFRRSRTGAGAYIVEFVYNSGKNTGRYQTATFPTPTPGTRLQRIGVTYSYDPIGCPDVWYLIKPSTDLLTNVDYELNPIDLINNFTLGQYVKICPLSTQLMDQFHNQQSRFAYMEFLSQLRSKLTKSRLLEYQRTPIQIPAAAQNVPYEDFIPNFPAHGQNLQPRNYRQQLLIEKLTESLEPTFKQDQLIKIRQKNCIRVLKGVARDHFGNDFYTNSRMADYHPDDIFQFLRDFSVALQHTFDSRPGADPNQDDARQNREIHLQRLLPKLYLQNRDLVEQAEPRLINQWMKHIRGAVEAEILRKPERPKMPGDPNPMRRTHSTARSARPVSAQSLTKQRRNIERDYHPWKLPPHMQGRYSRAAVKRGQKIVQDHYNKIKDKQIEDLPTLRSVSKFTWKRQKTTSNQRSNSIRSDASFRSLKTAKRSRGPSKPKSSSRSFSKPQDKDSINRSLNLSGSTILNKTQPN